MSDAFALARVQEARPASAGDRPLWSVDGREWPLRQHSRFVEAGGLRWHVQQYGCGPDLLLLHGAAASTHSWRDFGPHLSHHFRVLAIDFPGHAFTTPPDNGALYRQREMARATGELLRRLGVAPSVIVGHSAGAALGAALVLETGATPQALVALNGALDPRHAFSGDLFSRLARMASSRPVAQLFAWRASLTHVERVIRSTGSELDPWGLELYRRLFARRGHVSAAFRLMSEWNTHTVLDRLAELSCPLLLVAADDDRAVPPSNAARLARSLPNASLIRLRRGGHLAHEAEAAMVADVVLKALSVPTEDEVRP